MHAKHNFEMLMVRDGEVFDVRFSDENSAPHFSSRTLKVKEKGDAKEVGGGRVRFQFILDRHADATWRELFDLVLKGKPNPHLDVKIADAEMFLICGEEALVATYQNLKNAITETNRLYDQERTFVVGELQRRADQNARAATTAAQRQAGLNEKFSKLDL